jgi:hypothetical protein
LDMHLAALYGVEASALNRAVKRNRDRFAPDFMFQAAPDSSSPICARVSAGAKTDATH